MPTVLCMVPYADKTWDLDLYNHDDRRSLEVVVLASGRPEWGGGGKYMAGYVVASGHGIGASCASEFVTSRVAFSGLSGAIFAIRCAISTR